MRRKAIACLGIACLGLAVLVPTGGGARADARQDACKNAMNARIQVCTDDCTARALRAASDYRDTNNNVKFGCLKGCAIGEVLQMRACVSGKTVPAGDPTETNR